MGRNPYLVRRWQDVYREAISLRVLRDESRAFRIVTGKAKSERRRKDKARL
jgi:hypothetical protein